MTGRQIGEGGSGSEEKVRECTLEKLPNCRLCEQAPSGSGQRAGAQSSAVNTPGSSLSQPLTSEPNSCPPISPSAKPGAPAAPGGGAQMSEGWQGEPGCAEVNHMFFEKQEVGQLSAVLGKEPRVGGVGG